MKSSKEFFIVLTKQGIYQNLTRIMNFIVTYRHKKHHQIKILSKEVIIFMNESNRKIFNNKIKDVNGDEQGSQYLLQSSHVQLFLQKQAFLLNLVHLFQNQMIILRCILPLYNLKLQ